MRATRCYRLTNADASTEHYTLVPEEQFAAMKDMRRRGLNMLGAWHSHPATPARMSDEDLRLAVTPDIIYVIVSLSSPGTPHVGAWLVEDGTCHEVTVRVIAESPGNSAGLSGRESHPTDV